MDGNLSVHTAKVFHAQMREPAGIDYSLSILPTVMGALCR